MPNSPPHGLTSLSLFSGGGGLDLGFHRAGYDHLASYEILDHAAATLRANQPSWTVFGGGDGDVTQVAWRKWRRKVDVLHGGPPCQPFSIAGRQQGSRDGRDMFPAFVSAVLAIEPRAFVAENVAALGGPKFAGYLRSTVIDPLRSTYHFRRFELRAELFGVPQQRRRLLLVGFRRKTDAERFSPPPATHAPFGDPNAITGIAPCMGAREALGLPDTGFDALAPTIRSSLTGPRHTTSILNSVSSLSVWGQLQIWPNGVAANRDDARLFVTKNGHFRLAVPDVALLQGFPADWAFQGAVYMALGQIGNAVPPPLAYAVASSVAAVLA